MGLCIKNANILGKKADVLIESDRIVAIGKIDEYIEGCGVIQADGLTLLPAFVDMHTHLREPGFEGKETIATGSMAAVAGGYASV